MVYVIKANGEKAHFERKKIIHTCKRAGVPNKVAEKIAAKVSDKVRDGTTTKQVLGWVLTELDDYEAHHSSKYDLKRAIAELEPAEHEFERYIEHVLRAHGYKAKWNQIIQGECIEHQIDIVAEKDSEQYLVECKHHLNPHRFCGLGDCLQTWAAFDDIKKGPKGKEFKNVWLVNNTKFSEHAIRYLKAKNMRATGWNYPKELDLRHLIESKGMYPITILSTEKDLRKRLANASILLVKELVSDPVEELHRKTGIKRRTLENLVQRAKDILKS
jgi:hypothetical protein